MLAGSSYLTGEELKSVAVDLKEPAPHRQGNTTVELGVLGLGYYRIDIKAGPRFAITTVFSRPRVAHRRRTSDSSGPVPTSTNLASGTIRWTIPIASRRSL